MQSLLDLAPALTQLEAAPQARPVSRLVRLLACAVVVLTFVPYAAVEVGSSSNLPYCVLASIALWALAPRDVRVDLAAIALMAIPILSTFIASIVVAPATNSNGMVLQTIYIWPLFGGLIALRVLSDSMVPLLSALTLGTAAFGIVQKMWFLDRGSIPLLSMYDLNGYASVRAHQVEIVTYIRRPFAQFPEPSVMAGSLALATMLLVILRSSGMGRSGRLPLAATVVSAVAIAMSGSGSAVVSLVLIAIAFVVPRLRRNLLVPLGAPVVIGAAVWFGIQVARVRQDTANYSWSDRGASIVGACREIVGDAGVFIFGIGRGMSPVYFAEGRIRLDGLSYFHLLPDVYSVLVRFVLETGVVLGGPILLWVGARTFKGARLAAGALVGVVAVVLWLLVAGLTISYDTASWIWLYPGVLAGSGLAGSANHSAPGGGR